MIIWFTLTSCDADIREVIMTHKRKDTLTAPPEWWKHLRPFNKRRVSKKERLAAKDQLSESVPHDKT